MTLEEVKSYLRIDYTDDDDILSELIIVSGRRRETLRSTLGQDEVRVTPNGGLHR